MNLDDKQEQRTGIRSLVGFPQTPRHLIHAGVSAKGEPMGVSKYTADFKDKVIKLITQ